MLKLGLIGARGRMGQQVRAALAEQQVLGLGAILLRKDAAVLPGCADEVWQGSDAQTFVARCDVVLDFSAPAMAQLLAPICARHNRPYVLASTGLTEEDRRVIAAAQQHSAVLVAANLSLGIAVLEVVLEQAGRLLPHWDAELIEAHHRHKRDAPSGTARALGAALMRGAGQLGEEHNGPARPTPRNARTLGYSVVRGGDVPGEHTMWLLGDNERLELGHRAQSRRIFAVGALRACAFLHDKPAGAYSMRDVVLG